MKTRADLYSMSNGNKVTTIVDAYAIPYGAVVEVSNIGETTILKAGNTRYTNDAISKYLISLGIKGPVVIHNSRATSVIHWLTYTLANDIPLDDVLYYISIYTLNGVTTVGDCSGALMPIYNINPVTIPVSRIHHYCDRVSLSRISDGVLAVAKDGELYKINPQRYITANIVNVVRDDQGTISKLICEIEYFNSKYIVVADNIGRNVHSVDANEPLQVGGVVKVQYTSFSATNRVRSFSSPAIVKILKSHS